MKLSPYKQAFKQVLELPKSQAEHEFHNSHASCKQYLSRHLIKISFIQCQSLDSRLKFCFSLIKLSKSLLRSKRGVERIKALFMCYSLILTGLAHLPPGFVSSTSTFETRHSIFIWSKYEIKYNSMYRNSFANLFKVGIRSSLFMQSHRRQQTKSCSSDLDTYARNQMNTC